ncbi:hypothetical protein AT05_01990 [Schleiferia thermophila str. Yellowstone]|jgi:hypothetical protein|uniref:hypothetical protein n=1 Tax=Schleiferia thermophila TaxID=884107 RepID=UPI0004E71509|nr:hypothetical protein [Schleiferia thermophila]KFD40345.1 hypothetical protein AT05_01990 [Schleiferia thermophila str. Yellowstone]PMB31001.1 hypothetical protein CEN47_11850 [Fischerella thermalis CCMEE 5319]
MQPNKWILGAWLFLFLHTSIAQVFVFDYEITYEINTIKGKRKDVNSMKYYLSSGNEYYLIKYNIDNEEISVLYDYQSDMMYMIQPDMNMKMKIGVNRIVENLVPKLLDDKKIVTEKQNIVIEKNHKTLLGYTLDLLHSSDGNNYSKIWLAPQIETPYIMMPGMPRYALSELDKSLKGILLEMEVKDGRETFEFKATQVIDEKQTLDLSKIKFTNVPGFRRE